MRKTRSTADMLYSGALMLMVFFLLWIIVALIAFKMLTSGDSPSKSVTIKQHIQNALARVGITKPAISGKRAK